MKANLSNSIYQRKGSNPGLTVKDGMLINNRPDGVTGIRQAVDLGKAIKKAEKIATYSEAFRMGDMMSHMGGGSCECGM